MDEMKVECVMCANNTDKRICERCVNCDRWKNPDDVLPQEPDWDDEVITTITKDQYELSD